MLFSLECDRLEDLELPFITILDSANTEIVLNYKLFII